MDRLLKGMSALMFLMVFAVGCNKTDTSVNGEDNGVVLAHDYVDLGLPSGILWATCNMGANSPEEIGDYIAWGETEPKELYDWKSYKYAVNAGGYFEMTKYCTESSWGLSEYIDNLTVLEPEDDAIRTCWGTGWGMPTKEDWTELCQETTCILTTQNGVKGRLVTGKNGNSIFLPTTGFRLNDELICPNLGIYWSSSLYTGSPERAWSFHFDNDGYHVCGTYERNRGQVVRAVCSSR